MYHQSSDHLHYTWSSPTTSATGQTQETLQGIPHQKAYHVPFHSQVYPSHYYEQYYHVDNQSQHMPQPLSPSQGHLHPSSWNTIPPFPHEPRQSHLYYPHFQHPSSPPNLFHNFNRFSPPTPQFSYANSGHRRLHHGIVTNADGTRVPASIKPGILRGPPRKPRQSGHALWVGNLPSSTDIIKLKEHFSAAATATIESVFWISKSHSAFVNYRTAEALSDAMNRFHDSKFEAVRLVCRVRKTGSPVPINISTAVRPGDDQERALFMAVDESVGTANSGRSSSSSSELPRASEVGMQAPFGNNAKKRFFIMKSLATEDLESSARDGHWVTQQHNETTLNEAFVCAEEVFLIFSANKSGEYFGYARMQELIDGQSPRSRPPKPAEDNLKTCESDMPEIVFTPGTEHAPEGAIFIDAHRGTIFWEADIASQDNSTPKLFFGGHEVKVGGESTDTAKNQEWNLSSPFKVEWISTNRLPFYRTKGLRNPWNANKDVKVARDGTELETNLGIRLLELFHQPILPAFWDSNGYTPVGFQTSSPA